MGNQKKTIPKGWSETTLEKVVEITSSKRIFAEEYKKSGIPFFRGKEVSEKFSGNEISTELFISEEKYEDIKKKFGVPKENDILLTSVGTLGNPYLVEKGLKFYFKDGNLTWFHNYKNLDPKFLFYWMISPQGKETLSYAKIGSTQEAYTIAKLKTLSCVIPSPSEQHAIAAVLSSLDDKIDLLRKQNKILEAIAQAIFKEWFVDFNFPSATGKMINSEIGEIPEQWLVGGLIEDKISKFVKTNIEQFDGVKDYVETSNVNLSNFVGSFDKITFSDRPSRANMQPIANSFWFARMADSRKYLIFQDRDNNNISSKILSTGFAGIQSIKEYLYFYWCFILSDIFNNFKNQYAEGAVQVAISNGGIKRIKLALPPIELAKKFTETVEFFFEKISNNNHQIQTLSALRDTILPELMKGKVRVREFDN